MASRGRACSLAASFASARAGESSARRRRLLATSPLPERRRGPAGFHAWRERQAAGSQLRSPATTTVALRHAFLLREPSRRVLRPPNTAQASHRRQAHAIQFRVHRMRFEPSSMSRRLFAGQGVGAYSPAPLVTQTPASGHSSPFARRAASLKPRHPPMVTQQHLHHSVLHRLTTRPTPVPPVVRGLAPADATYLGYYLHWSGAA